MREVIIKIDDQQVELDATTEIRLSADFPTPYSSGSGERSMRRLSIPITPTNRQIMGFAEQVMAVQFNASVHTLCVVIDDREVLRGEPVLVAVEREGEGGRYLIDVRAVHAGWREAVGDRKISDLGISYSATINAETIADSWNATTPVCFLPVCRNAVGEQVSSTATIEDVTKEVAVDDYHPFLNLRQVIRTIFSDAGYTLQSQFLSSTAFGRLYMSGGYPESDASALERRMGFLARRAVAGSATADYAGCVYASTLYSSHTVGNPVDVDSSAAYSDTYNRNGCFRLVEGRAAFVPTSEVSVGFVYDLRYRTDYRIDTRDSLKGFNKVWLNSALCNTFRIANPFEDYRQTPIAGYSYKIMVFEPQTNHRYRLAYRLNGVQYTTSWFLARMYPVDLGSEGDTLEILRLEIIDQSTGIISTCTDDWALYLGYVEESGSTDVALTLRTPPMVLRPNKPFYFDELVFGGADEGMNLRLEAGVSIRPVFYSFAMQDAAVTWADVSVGEYTQQEVVDAVCHMYNLRVVENPFTRTMVIEPADSLYTSMGVTDWSSRVVTSQNIRLSDYAADFARCHKLAYRTADSSVRGWNRLTNEEFGAWSVDLGASRSSVDEHLSQNPLFSPTLSVGGCFAGSASAQIPKVANTDLDVSVGNLNFSPRVVQFVGMQTLPTGESWGWPSYGTSYPLATFHLPEKGVNLCFEDRGGVAGLNSRYLRTSQIWRTSQRVTLALRVTPAEVAAMMDPSAVETANMAIYTLSIDGENERYVLESIDDYSPDRGIATCSFIKTT